MSKTPECRHGTRSLFEGTRLAVNDQEVNAPSGRDIAGEDKVDHSCTVEACGPTGIRVHLLRKRLFASMHTQRGGSMRLEATGIERRSPTYERWSP